MSFREFKEAYLEGLPTRLAYYRAHMLAFLAFLLGALEVVDPYALASILPDRWNGLVLIGVSLTVYLLRKLLVRPPEEIEPSTEEERGA